MGLPAQLFLKCACSSRGTFYFVLNSDPQVSHRLDTQSGKVCRDAWKYTFVCPSAVAMARLGLPGSCPHFPGQKGSCQLEQHKGARSCPPAPNARSRDRAVAKGCRGDSLHRDVAVMQHGCPHHRSSHIFIFSGTEEEGAGTPHTAAPCGPAGSQGQVLSALLSQGLWRTAAAPCSSHAAGVTFKPTGPQSCWGRIVQI